MTAVGIDFGLTFVKVAQPDPDGNDGHLVGEDTFPDIWIKAGGSSAANRRCHPGAGLRHNLAATLGSPAFEAHPEHSGQIEQEVAHLANTIAQLVGTGGPVTIALSHAWRSRAPHTTRLVRNAFARAFKVPNLRLVSSSQAAAAYVLQRESIAGKGALLLYDVGGEETTLTRFLFNGKSGPIKPVYTGGVSCGGHEYDRQLAAILGQDASQFECQRRQIQEKFELEEMQLWDIGDASAYPDLTGDKTLSIGQLRAVADEIAKRVSQVNDPIGAETWQMKNLKAAIVGGFGWFPPLHGAIRRTAGKKVTFVDDTFTDTDRLGAAAYGALAIAQRRVEPVPRVSSIMVMAHHRHAGRLEALDLDLTGPMGIEIDGFLPEPLISPGQTSHAECLIRSGIPIDFKIDGVPFRVEHNLESGKYRMFLQLRGCQGSVVEMTFENADQNQHYTFKAKHSPDR